MPDCNCKGHPQECPGEFQEDGLPWPWECTEPKGHDGPHIACGVTSHRLMVWGE